MKTYYCVSTVIYDDVRVNCHLVAIEEAKRKPKNIFIHQSNADHYLDYFDTEEDAREFVEQSKNA